MTDTTIPILYEDGEALVIDKPAGLPIDRPRKGGPCQRLPAARAQSQGA